MLKRQLLVLKEWIQKVYVRGPPDKAFVLEAADALDCLLDWQRRDYADRAPVALEGMHHGAQWCSMTAGTAYEYAAQ